MVFSVVGYLFFGVVEGIDKATAFPEKQSLFNRWQKKNNTLAGLFDFVGAGHCFIEILNLPIDVLSDGLHSQKQCKDFRFSY
jgi:hypothetical protein